MEAILLYWLKANVVLALAAAAYYGLLRQLTFFALNRVFLLVAVAFAAVYPLLPVPALLPANGNGLPLLTATYSLPLALPGPGVTKLASSNLPYLLWAGIGLYGSGVAGLLVRLLGQLLSLAWVRRRARPATVLGQAVRVIPGAGSPFSFGTTIYLTGSALRDTASLPAALRHEQAHVRQAHTLDVLLLQVATALTWPNPAAWLLRRATLDNLEYLADRAALAASGLSCRDYQYLLLRQQAGAVPAPALALRVEFFTLKSRITRLGQPLSSTRQRGRYLLAATLVAMLALGYAGARAQPAPPRITASYPTDVKYYLDGEPSSVEVVRKLDQHTFASVDILKDSSLLSRDFPGVKRGVIVITTQANVNSPAVLALEERANLASGYTFTPAAVNAVVPKALAYITSHYPSARLSGEVTEVKKKSTGLVQYRVQLATGRRPFYVFFSPEGDFLGETLK